MTCIKLSKNKNIKRKILKRQFGVNSCTYYYKGHSDLFGHYNTISVPSRNQSYKSHGSFCAELSATESKVAFADPRLCLEEARVHTKSVLILRKPHCA